MRGKLWNFIKPADAARVIRFENTGETFSAMYQARHWLHEHGYCYGSSDWSHYIPAMKGERYTLPQKLYNFDREDYDQVSAVMYSLDYRDGWVEVWLVEQGMMVLDLVLKHQWYDMIDSGEKPEEYRDVTPYWRKRLQSGKRYTHVRFHRGYTAKTMIFRFDGLHIGRGNTQWGAPADRDVFIIGLGERYNTVEDKAAKLMARMAEDVKDASLKVEDIADRYVKTATPELRQQLIDKLTEMRKEKFGIE